MDELYRAILALDRPPGPAVRALRLGDWALRLEGLDAELLATLERRWGAFLQPAGGDPPRATLRLHRADAPRFLTRTPAGELYRVEARNAAEERVIVSYHFAVVAEDRGRVFRLALAAQAEEPAGRVVENAVRVIAARLAAEDGGFALHAGGVLRGGRAYLLAGPSGAGKTTAVRLTGARALGDDYGLVLPAGGAWSAAAVPFDNAEAIGPAPPLGLHALAGIWRLHQAPATRVEHPRGSLAVASLLGCLTVPWVLPEQAGPLLENVMRFVSSGAYAHLYFSLGAELWAHLDPLSRP